MTEPLILLERDGPVALLVNNRPEKHNAFSDEMDRQLFAALDELDRDTSVRCIVWRGNGPSFSSGRDVGELGVRTEDLSDLQFIERGHRWTSLLLSLHAPVVAALHGWVIGGSFERALLCDLRVAAAGTRMRLPEVHHGVIPDSGGVARLFQMAGHGLATDLALTGRTLTAEEALAHGVVSRVVPDEELAQAALALGHEIASLPPFTVKMARRVIRSLAAEEVRRSMAEEALAQSLVFASADYAELKAARREGRDPDFRGR